MNNVEILIAIVGASALLYFAGRSLSRKRFFKGRAAIDVGEIVRDLPSGIDRGEAENLMRVIGRSFGLRPEILRLQDSFSELEAIDSWSLGEGMEYLEQWLSAHNITSFDSRPQTIGDLIISVLSAHTD